MTTTGGRLAFAFSMLAAGLALAAPASAQFGGGRPAFDQRSGPKYVQFRDSFWGDRRSSYPNNSYDPYNPFYRRPQVYESIKPPAPRKVDKPPAETVVIIGDALGDWLGYGLEQVFAETPEIGIVRKIKPDLGLARDEARLEVPEWSQTVKDLLATEKPNAIVVMLGVNDRLPLRDRVPATKGTAHYPTTTTIQPPPRPKRSAGRRAETSSFIPTNGLSFIPSASTT
jgi:uncharacterized protein